MNTFDILLGFQVCFDVLDRVLDKQLPKLELGVIEWLIAGDVAWNAFGFACINQRPLTINHELLVAEVATDDNIIAEQRDG